MRQCSSSSGYKDPIIGYLGFGEQYCSTGFGYVDDYRVLGSLGSLLVLGNVGVCASSFATSSKKRYESGREPSKHVFIYTHKLASTLNPRL